MLLLRKVWFVVLVGLLLGLACGAVMARWPSLRGIAAGVAVVGTLLLGRVVGWMPAWLARGAVGLLAVGSVLILRRYGMNPWPIVATGCALGGAVFAWRSVLLRDELRHVREINTTLSQALNRNASVCSAACDVLKSATGILSQSLLNGRSASVVQQHGEAFDSSVFVEWDDAPERTRAALPLPTDAAPSADAEQIKRDCAHAAEKLKSDPKLADNAKAHLDIAAKALADSLIRRETLRKSPFYVADDEREVTLIAQRPKFSKAYFLARIGADACYRLPDGKLDVKTANRALYDAFKPLVEGELLPPPPPPAEHTDWAKPIRVRSDDFQAPPRKPIESHTPQPLQSFPTDEEIRAWRWWERVSASYPHAKLAELFFDAAGNLIDAQSASKILRFSDGMEATQTRDDVTTTVLDDYRRDAWRKAPAPTVVPRNEIATTQIAPAADREAAAK